MSNLTEKPQTLHNLIDSYISANSSMLNKLVTNETY